MTTLKRLTNTVGIKVKYIPQTNTKPAKIKVTQTNCNKSVLVNASSIDMRTDDFICTVLDTIDIIKSYSLVIDNTQSEYYVFSVDFKGCAFENILNHFKN